MQPPTKGYFKTHYNSSNTQSILLEKQKDALLVILTDYIEKTADKTATLESLSKLDPSLNIITQPCSKC
jgi:hypothetical protein